MENDEFQEFAKEALENVQALLEASLKGLRGQPVRNMDELIRRAEILAEKGSELERKARGEHEQAS